MSMNRADTEDAIQSDSASYGETSARQAPGWLKVGVVAVTSALAGGLAAAWFYRKTLARLRQAEAEQSAGNSNLRETEEMDDGA